ncbi:MAG: hypothetical protein PVJ57_16295 [Phycisphaerae bacterium]
MRRAVSYDGKWAACPHVEARDSNQRRTRAGGEPFADEHNDMEPTPELSSFYALQPNTLTSDRLYRIFITRQAICGAWVAGQFHSRESAQQVLVVTLGLLSFLARPLVNRWLRKREEREQFYDALDPDGAEFLEADKRNFRLLPMDIDGVTITQKKKFSGHGVRGPRLTITRSDGKALKLVVLPEHEPQIVHTALCRLIPGAELV